MDTTLGQLIASIRTRRGWNQTRLAREARVSVSTIAHVETGREMQKSTAVAIFDALVDTPPGLRRGEAELFLRLAGLDPALADNRKVIPDTPGTLAALHEPELGDDLDRLKADIDRVIAQARSPRSAAALVRHMLDAIEGWMRTDVDYMAGPSEPERTRRAS